MFRTLNFQSGIIFCCFALFRLPSSRFRFRSAKISFLKCSHNYMLRNKCLQWNEVNGSRNETKLTEHFTFFLRRDTKPLTRRSSFLFHTWCGKGGNCFLVDDFTKKASFYAQSSMAEKWVKFHGRSLHTGYILTFRYTQFAVVTRNRPQGRREVTSA